MKPIGRVQPYTPRGIVRVPCARCGGPSRQQWQLCALGNRYFGCCESCDVELNRLVLRFMRVPDAAHVMAKYAMSANA